jgi:hypothetical protein
MAFNAPINTIAPIPTPANWVRPADWIAITDTANEVQFLVCDLGAKAFTIRTTFSRTSGNIYIDWGDGVIDTITTTSSTDTSHVYSTGGTPCSRGYNTFKIRVYGDATCVITNARHIPNFAVTGGSPKYNIGLLEAYFGNNTCNNTSFLQNYFTSEGTSIGNGTFSFLEYVKLPSVVTWTNQSGMFQNCRSLSVVIMPTSASSLNTLDNFFSGCVELLDISIPTNSTAIASFISAFSSCYNLRTISFPTTLNSCTNFNNAFQNCYSLKNVTLPSINLATTLSGLFSFCLSLQWVKFTSLPTPALANTTITFGSGFQNCSNLQNVYFPSTSSTNAIYSFGSAFSACYNLKNILFPINFRASTLTNTFQNCYSITNVVFQSAMTNLSNMNFTFQNCFLLNSITLPTTIGSTISMQSTFSACYSLSNLTIPSGWVLGDLSGIFSGCNNIISVNLPNNTQNSITGFSAAFNGCTKLQSVVLPTSMTSVNNMLQTFNNCGNLTSITLPSTMNSVTTMNSTFSNCYLLTSLTLPTSMTSCTDFASMAANCLSLKTLTMPTSVSTATTTYAGIVINCSALETLTLPTTQTSSLNNIGVMFNSCSNLNTINNLDKVGSLTATPLVAASMVSTTATYANIISSLSFRCPFSQLVLNGSTTTTNFNKLNSLRLLNTSAGQWTGTSPQINVSFCDLSTSALNTLFADIAAQGVVVSKTINITSCTGAAGLTAADRLVLTSRGWTITG